MACGRLALAAAFGGLAAARQTGGSPEFRWEPQPGCLWPNCTSTCDECHSVPFTTCLISLPFTDDCGEHAHCSNRLCTCEEGYCRARHSCVAQRCLPGARPIPYEPNSWTRSLASLGPKLPRNVRREDWLRFLWGSSALPIAISVLGAAVATGTFLYVHHKEEHSYLEECLPSTPYLLLGMATFGFVAVLFGIAMRHVSMLRVFAVGRGQLVKLHSDIVVVQDHAVTLNETTGEISSVFFALPESCNGHILFSKMAATTLVHKAGKYVDQVVEMMGKVERMVSDVEVKLGVSADASRKGEQFLLGLPILPVLLMFLVTMAILFVTLVSWCHHDPEVADRADDVFFAYGGCCIFFLILTSSLLAAAYLWVGIAEGALCMDVDENLASIVGDYFLTRSVDEKAGDLDPLVDQTFLHYLTGRVSNPLVDTITSIERELKGIEHLWDEVRAVQSAASVVCSGFGKFHIHTAFQQIASALASMRTLLLANNVWPYYKAIMHLVVCGSLVESQGYLVVINIVVGLLFFPALSVIAHADLDRWSHWKSQNGLGSRGRGQRPDRSYLKRRRKGENWQLLATPGSEEEDSLCSEEESSSSVLERKAAEPDPVPSPPPAAPIAEQSLPSRASPDGRCLPSKAAADRGLPSRAADLVQGPPQASLLDSPIALAPQSRASRGLSATSSQPLLTPLPPDPRMPLTLPAAPQHLPGLPVPGLPRPPGTLSCSFAPVAPPGFSPALAATVGVQHSRDRARNMALKVTPDPIARPGSLRAWPGQLA